MSPLPSVIPNRASVKRNSGLKTAPAYANLTAATDERVMEPIFRDELSKVWNRPLQFSKFFIPRVVPIGGGKFLIQYRFTTVEAVGSRNWIFFGRILAPDEMVPAFAQKPNAFFLADLRLVVPVFPFDPKLKILPKFFQPDNSSEVLQGLEPVFGNPLKIENVEVLGYRLELRSRSLLRVDLKENSKSVTVIAKVMRAERAAQLFANLEELERLGFDAAAADGITIPHPMAYSSEGIIWLEPVFDPPLHDLVGKEEFVSGCRAAAQTLGKLQTVSLRSLLPYNLAEELLLLGQAAAETARIYPVLSEQLNKTLFLIEKNAPSVEERELTPVHRDFYDKQLLIGKERTTLIDADTLALSDPALDVGNFLAHLFLRASQHPPLSEQIKQGRQAFTEEYRAKALRAQNFWRRASWWEAASLLRLGCLYALRPRWKHLALPLLERAEKILIQLGGTDA